jgi:RNA polymerase sigma-70 factor, ECF subfamily
MAQLALAEESIPNPPGGVEQTFETHHGMVFRTAYRITGNAADAEDVLQTVFLRLLRRDPAAGDLLQPESYLRRAAINVSLDVVRSKQRNEELTDDRAGPAAPDPALRDALRRALAKLDRRHAEMFVLRFLEGHSNGEIADMLGLSRFGVAVTLHRVRRKLQTEMEASL